MTSFTSSPLVGATEHCTPKQADTRTVFSHRPSLWWTHHSYLSHIINAPYWYICETVYCKYTGYIYLYCYCLVIVAVCIYIMYFFCSPQFYLNLFLHWNQRVAKNRRKIPCMFAHTYLAVKPDSDSYKLEAWMITRFPSAMERKWLDQNFPVWRWWICLLSMTSVTNF